MPSPVAGRARGPRALRRPAGPPRARLRRAVVPIAAALLACELLLAAQGSIEIMHARAALGSSPDWARACAGHVPRQDRQLLHFCTRVRGRVLWVRDEGDPSGVRKTHILVVADMHLLVVKLRAGLRAPSAGAGIEAVGPMVRARNGLREVEAVAL